MSDVKSQFLLNIQSMIDSYPLIKAQLSNPNLADDSRKLYEKKLSVIRMITGVYKFLNEHSEKLETMIGLCLSGGKCTTEKAMRLGFNSVDHMRSNVDQLRSILLKGAFNAEIIESLIHTNSIDEVDRIIDWYKVNVVEDVELKRFITRNKLEE